MKILSFLKKNLVYGLAGFFVASAILVGVADFLNVKNIPGFYFWLLPFGFVVGLVFPRYAGQVFMNAVSRGQENPEKELNLDKAVKGPAVVVVKIVAFAALVILVWVVFNFAKQDLWHK